MNLHLTGVVSAHIIRRSAAFVAIAALGLSAAACGGDDGGGDAGDAGQDAGDASGDDGGGSGGGGGGTGDWTGELETGTGISATLWVPASEADLASFEAFREVAGAAPVVYGRVTVTNDGAEEDRGRFLTLTGPDGNAFGDDAVEVNFLCSVVGQWWNDIPAEDRVDEVIEQYTSLLNDDCDGGAMGGPAVSPGASTTYYVAHTGGEPEFSRVFAGVQTELTR